MPEGLKTGQGTIRCADITIDLGRRRVTQSGREVKLGPLTYALLVQLVENAPNVLTHDDLSQTVWAGRPVSPETVVQRVKLLRDALGDDPSSPRYIEALRGHGYRLIPKASISSEASSSEEPAAGRAIVARWIAATIFVAMIGVGLWMERSQGPIADNAGARPTSLAVLPFSSQSLGTQDTRFLALGVHDDIITQLARRTPLRVISRTSVMGYADTHRNITQIGRELGADAILEGNLQRSGNTLDLNVQLVDARTDTHLWAQNFSQPVNDSDLISVQNELADAVVAAMRTTISARAAPSTVPQAYAHYLNAIGYRNQQSNFYESSFSLIVDQLEKAIALDPDFAVAHAELSHAYSDAHRRGADQSEAMLDRALSAVNRALEIDPDLPEGHFAMGSYLFQRGDLVGARRETRRAARGMPESTRVTLALAFAEAFLGDLEAAGLLLESAQSTDPLNPAVLSALHDHSMDTKDYASAERHNRQLINLQPDSEWAWANSARVVLHRTQDVRAAVEASREIPVELNPFLRIEIEWLWNVFLRDYETALKSLDTMDFETMSVSVFYAPKSFFYAMARYLAGHPDASKSLAHAESELRLALQQSPSDPRIQLTLAQVLAAWGEDRAALSLIEKALDSPIVKNDQKRGQYFRLNAIRALGLTPYLDRTIELLRSYLAGEIGYPWNVLRQDPRLDAVRSHPEFAALDAA